MAGVRKKYLKIFGFFVVTFIVGAGLASLSVALGSPVGAIGALALVGWAIFARRRWQALRELDGSEPGAPERVVWHRFAGCIVVWGHMMFGLLNPQYDLHVGSGNYLAIDNWTLIFGALISAWLFRGDGQERDERDDRIDAIATKWGYGSLIVLLLMTLSFIGFREGNNGPGLNDFFIANLLMSLIILSAVVRQGTQLFAYVRESEPLP